MVSLKGSAKAAMTASSFRSSMAGSGSGSGSSAGSLLWALVVTVGDMAQTYRLYEFSPTDAMFDKTRTT